jgi:hypothetical protein
MIRRLLLRAAIVVAVISIVSVWWLMPIAAVIYAVAELAAPRRGRIRAGADADQTSAAVLLGVTTTLLVIREGAIPLTVWEVAAALAIVHAGYLGGGVLGVIVTRRWRSAIDWRDLEVRDLDAGHPDVELARVRRLPDPSGRFVSIVPVVIAAPTFVAFGLPSFLFLIVAAAAIVWTVLGVVMRLVPVVIHNLRLPPEPARMRALLASVRALGPEIVVHFDGPIRSSYAINEWIGVLDRLNERHRVIILVVDRQPWHFATILGDRLPIVHLRGAEAIESLITEVPSLKLALYPRSTEVNKNILRVPGLYDAYINHGQSDRADAVNAAARAFDEIWVVGDAEQDRYLDAGIGVRKEQLRIVGRPQLAELERRRSPKPTAPQKKTVVYAPTWEGNSAVEGYCSLLDLGEQIVTVLLTRFTVVYAPHPALGTVDARYARATARISARVARAGGAHGVAVSVDERRDALAGADLLVTDIGTDLVDFLALDRPVVVTNPTDRPEDAFLAEYPSAEAGIIVGPRQLDGLVEAITEAIEKDPKRHARERVAKYYLGDRTTATEELFFEQVDSCLELVASKLPRAVPSGLAESPKP